MNKTKILVISALALSVSIGAYGLALASEKSGFPTRSPGEGDWNKVKISTSTQIKGLDDDENSTSTLKGPGFQAVNGTVTSVGSSTLMIRSENKKVYTVNITASSTKILSAPKVVIQLSDIKIGDKLNIQGKVSSTTISASRIMDITLGEADKVASSTKEKESDVRSFFGKMKNFFRGWFGKK